MTDQATHYCWDNLADDFPMDKLSRRRVIGSQAMISRVHLRSGCEVPAHAHANEQFACVLSGALEFTLGEPGTSEHRKLTVRGGEVLHLPSNVLHAATAVEDTIVLDVFSPPSEKTGIDRH